MATIMSWTLSLTLVLVILVDSFYVSTASPAEFYVSKHHIRKCRCKVFPNGLLKCRSPLLPTNIQEKMDLIKCLCSKRGQRRFPELKAVCASWNPGFPITPV